MLRECPSIRLRILHTPGLMQSSPRCVPSVQLLGGIAFLLCSLNAIAVSSGERFTPIAKITEGTTTTRNRGILAFRPPSPSSYELLRHHRSTYPENRYLPYIYRIFKVRCNFWGWGSNFSVRGLVHIFSSRRCVRSIFVLPPIRLNETTTTTSNRPVSSMSPRIAKSRRRCITVVVCAVSCWGCSCVQ